MVSSFFKSSELFVPWQVTPRASNPSIHQLLLSASGSYAAHDGGGLGLRFFPFPGVGKVP